MKRRSRAGGELTKGRRRTALKPKRRNAPKAVARSQASPPGEETEVARLTRERDEALEQQTATGDVLKIISRPSFDLQAVLDTLVKLAARLCEADLVAIHRPRDGAMQFAANFGLSQEWEEIIKRAPIVPGRGTATGRVLLTGKVVQIADVEADPEYTFAEGRRAGGFRTVLAVPLEREGETIGVIVLCRTKVHPFTDKQIDLVQNFAAQAVIAIENARLLNELRQRTSDLTEALDRQTATSEVLSVISSSPGDFEPVFATMLEKAVRICGATFGNVYRFHDDALHLVASHHTPPAFVEYYTRKPIPIDPMLPFGRMVKSKSVVQVADLVTEEEFVRRDPAYVAGVELGGIRTFLAVPMFRDNELIGAFSLARHEVRLFTEKQIELVKNFAAQAVIAIENARLLNELRQSLDQQTATSEVLGVISSSPGDLEPVFASMLENAVRICDAKFGIMNFPEPGGVRPVAMHNVPEAFAELRHREPVVHFGPKHPLARAAATKQVVHIPDLELYADEDAVIAKFRELTGARTILHVPMLKDEELVGIVSIYRQEVRAFTDKQVDLVKNFAAQAVIAIENTRLLNQLRQRTDDLTERTAELTEALEQQTATSEVLQVISGSPGDLQPVFEAMLANAVRICDATFGNIYRWDGNVFSLVATHNTPLAYAEARRRSPVRPNPNNIFGLMVATKAVAHVSDAAEQLERGYPEYATAVELGGVRTCLAAPMLKEHELIGSISLFRQEVRPFTDKQIALITNFAAQAVIAIENARLLNELRQRTADLTERTADLTEALDQQTATSEVLEVISRSPGGLEPVFQAMLEKAVRICGAKFGSILRWDNEAAHLLATHNAPPAFAEARRRSSNPANPNTSFGRMVATKAVVHVADAAAEPGYLEQHDPAAVAAVELGGQRTALYVPMLKESELIGAFTLSRQEVRPFTDKQIELVQNFAAQAVIAIENTRLLDELRERTEEVEKLNKHLERRVSDQVGEIERMGRLRRFLPPQVADLIVASGTEKQLESHRREITALFCDLRGFTGFTESADAEDVMALLREYHSTVGEKIIKYSGTLERYAGDGVMVVFNDPVPVENPALQAVLMALEMRDAIGALTETWHRWGHDIGFGIGIAHGFATLGTIGFEGRFDYAAIGTVSNVASRLCDEAKPGQILISPRVLTKVESAVKVEPVGEFELKGIRRPLAAYNVVAASPSKV